MGTTIGVLLLAFFVLIFFSLTYFVFGSSLSLISHWQWCLSYAVKKSIKAKLNEFIEQKYYWWGKIFVLRMV